MPDQNPMFTQVKQAFGLENQDAGVPESTVRWPLPRKPLSGKTSKSKGGHKGPKSGRGGHKPKKGSPFPSWTGWEK